MSQPNPATEYFRQQDDFVAGIISAAKDGRLHSHLGPYIDWKIWGQPISRAEAYAMMDLASSELDRLFNDEKADRAIVSYLEAIDSELTNILPMLK